MNVSTTAGALMILGGLAILIILLRALEASPARRRSLDPDLSLARRTLKAAAAVIERHHTHPKAASVFPAEVRQTINSIARCTRVLRRIAADSQAAALTSIENSAVRLSSVLESMTRRAPRRRGRALRECV